MPDPSLIEALESKREKYDQEGCWQRFLLESFLGSGGFQGRVKQPPAGWWGQAAESYARFPESLLKATSVVEQDSYLDRHPREDAAKFKRRKQVAHYLNYVRPTTSLKVSYLVRKPHTRNNVPPALADWIKRTHYDREFRKRALTAAVLGWFPMLVDRPAVATGVRTAAQAGNMEPFLAPLLPVNLIDYELDEYNQYIWAKTCTQHTRRGAFNVASVRVYRYTIWTRSDFTVYEVEETDGNKKVTSQGAPQPHGLGRVPLVSWRAEASVEDPVKADSINADIAPEARRLFNVCSEFDEHIRGQAFALLVWPRKAQASAGGAPVGVENGIEIDPDQKNVPFFLAPPGQLAATFETRIEKSVIEIYRMARVEYDRASGTASSAQSKEQNFEQTNLAIADFAAAIAQADRETLIMVGLWIGIPQAKLDEIECVPAQDFSTESLNEEIDSIISVQTMSMGSTFKSELLKRLAVRLLPNLSPATQKIIDAEIDEEQVKAAQEKAALAAEPPDPNAPEPQPAPDPAAGNKAQRQAA